jgi:hypothetical protein
MTEPAKDFWARADRDLLDRWPDRYEVIFSNAVLPPSWTSSGS